MFSLLLVLAICNPYPALSQCTTPLCNTEDGVKGDPCLKMTDIQNQVEIMMAKRLEDFKEEAILEVRTEVERVAVRLAGGPSSNEGRLEVYYGGAWGTVYDSGIGNNEAKVFCRMMGKE